jgi:hypothetical protein
MAASISLFHLTKTMRFQKMAALFTNPNAAKLGDAVAPRRLAEWDPPRRVNARSTMNPTIHFPALWNLYEKVSSLYTKHDESHDTFSCSVESL